MGSPKWFADQMNNATNIVSETTRVRVGKLRSKSKMSGLTFLKHPRARDEPKPWRDERDIRVMR